MRERSLREKIEVRRILTVLLILLAGVGMHRADVIEDFISSRGLTPESSSVLVMDLLSGDRPAELNTRMPLIPASIMKSVTTASLLEKLDESYRFKTRVMLTGTIESRRLEGNIVVEGCGDPSLNSRFIKSPDICVEIADALRREGVDTVEGRIVIDEDLWSGPAVPPSWMSGDLPHAYGTGSHALNFEDNASGSRSVADPSAIFAARLKETLRRNGIAVADKPIRESRRELLLEHESAPLDEIIRSCMMRSDNQYAEALLRTFAVAEGKKGNTQAATAREKRLWEKKGAPLDDVTIVDGSGLSRQNRITAEFMAYILAAKADDPYYPSFFPLAGQEGTLRNFLAGTPLEGYVAMKTGSMNGIQCYAGYKLDEDYVPTHVIVVMMNDMRNRATARMAVADMLREIFVNENAKEDDNRAD